MLVMCFVLTLGQQMTPSELLLRVKEAYSQAATYRDEGSMVSKSRVSRSILVEGDWIKKPKIDFRILFKRTSSSWLIENTEVSGRKIKSVIWGSRGRARSWWSIDPHTRPAISLKLALNQQIVASEGLSRMLPELLDSNLILPEHGTSKFHLGTGATVRSYIFRGGPCYELSWTDESSSFVKITLSARTFHVFQYQWSTPNSERTYAFYPRHGEAIDDSEFEYRPVGLLTKQRVPYSRR